MLICHARRRTAGSAAMHIRNASRSFSVIGRLTVSTHRSGRSARPVAQQRPSVPSSPCARTHRLPQRHSSARSTTPAVRAFRSTYRQTVQKCSSFCDREALEPPLVQMPAAHRAVRHVPAHRVRVGQPAHEGGQLAVLPRPDHEVPVVPHQAPGQEPRRMPLLGLDHDPLEGRDNPPPCGTAAAGPPPGSARDTPTRPACISLFLACPKATRHRQPCQAPPKTSCVPVSDSTGDQLVPSACSRIPRIWPKASRKF